MAANSWQGRIRTSKECKLTKQVKVRLQCIHQMVCGVHTVQTAAAAMLKSAEIDAKAAAANHIKRHLANGPPHIHLSAAVGGGSEPVAQAAG